MYIYVRATVNQVATFSAACEKKCPSLCVITRRSSTAERINFVCAPLKKQGHRALFRAVVSSSSGKQSAETTYCARLFTLCLWLEAVWCRDLRIVQLLPVSFVYVLVFAEPRPVLYGMVPCTLLHLIHCTATTILFLVGMKGH